MKRQMRNLTYRNLMTVIHKIKAKGYDFEESERLARGIFDEFLAHPQGLSIEGRIGQIMNREDWNGNAGSVAADAWLCSRYFCILEEVRICWNP